MTSGRRLTTPCSRRDMKLYIQLPVAQNFLKSANYLVLQLCPLTTVFLEFRLLFNFLSILHQFTFSSRWHCIEALRQVYISPFPSSSPSAFQLGFLGFNYSGGFFFESDLFLSNHRGSPIPSSRIMHARFVFVASIHPSKMWMSGSFESMWGNACMHWLDLCL